MKKLYLYSLVLAFGVGASGCSDSDGESRIFGGEETPDYTNPVMTINVPEPGIMKGRDGNFYMFAGEELISNGPIYMSTDLVTWTYSTTAFTSATKPSYVDKGKVQSPQVVFANGKYIMYYTLYTDSQNTAVGAAVALYPEGPYKDKGQILSASSTASDNVRAPFFIEAEDVKYLFWSSDDGIFAVELSEDGLSIPENTQAVQIAAAGFVAPVVYRSGEYYYLFATENSSQIVAGRSSTLTGTFTNAAGIRMLDGGYEAIVAGNAAFATVCNGTSIVTDEKNVDWMLYNTVSGSVKQLMLDRIIWTDGWPRTAGGEPSSVLSAGPTFFQLGFN